jgi:hypothetical protein
MKLGCGRIQPGISIKTIIFGKDLPSDMGTNFLGI